MHSTINHFELLCVSRELRIERDVVIEVVVVGGLGDSEPEPELSKISQVWIARRKWVLARIGLISPLTAIEYPIECDRQQTLGSGEHILCILHHFTYFVYNSVNFFSWLFPLPSACCAKFPSFVVTQRPEEQKRKTFSVGPL